MMNAHRILAVSRIKSDLNNSFSIIQGYILGCYQDEYPPYVLPNEMTDFPGEGLSVARCVEWCFSRGYLLAGVRDR